MVSASEQRAMAVSQASFVRALQAVFVQQARGVLTSAPTLLRSGREVDLDDWVPLMVERLSPFLMRYYLAGYHRAQERLKSVSPSLIGKAWRLPQRVIKNNIGVDYSLLDPKVLKAVDAAVLTFCQETNATVTGDLKVAIAKLRDEMKQGLSAGESVRALTARVRTIFTDPARAFRIATTESSRAMHAGQVMSWKETGNVIASRWLASPDACDACLALDGKEVPLGKPFIILPKGGPYAIVLFPPLHPHCFCDTTPVLGDVPRRKPRVVKPKPSSILVPGPAVFTQQAPPPPTKPPLSLDTTQPLGGRPVNPWGQTDNKKNAKKILPKVFADKQTEKARKEIIHRGDELRKKAQTLDSRLISVKDKLQEAFNNAVRVKKQYGEGSPEHLKARKEYNELSDERTKLSNERLAVVTNRDSEVEKNIREAMAPAEKVKVTPLILNPAFLAAKLQEDIKSVCTTLSEVTGPSERGETEIKVSFRSVPAHETQRSYALAGVVYLAVGTDKKTVAHEIGHALEYLYPKANEVLRAFWQERCGGENEVQLHKIFPLNGYGDREFGVLDSFWKAWGSDSVRAYYSGKRYPSGDTELLSMGLELLIADPSNFAEKDPEWFAVVVGILQGRYR